MSTTNHKLQLANDNDLFSQIVKNHPELNEVEKQLAKVLCRILEHLSDADVNREYLRYSGEARLLADKLGLVHKEKFKDDSQDLATLLANDEH